MIIRELRPDDLEELKRIHAKHYTNEFNFPNFNEHFLCAYVVEQDGKIITVGGIRTIMEVIAITDKDESTRKRIEALKYIYSASLYFAEQEGYKELHAFIQDKAWMKHLKKFNFKDTKGHALVLEI